MSVRLYIQIVNLLINVYDKYGSQLTGSFPTSFLWYALDPSSPCYSLNDGDPISCMISWPIAGSSPSCGCRPALSSVRGSVRLGRSPGDWYAGTW